MKIYKVITTIPGDNIGSLSVCYDFEEKQVFDGADVTREREITKIHWVEFVLADKIGFMMPQMLKDKEAVEHLETLILDEIEYTHTNELKQTA